MDVHTCERQMIQHFSKYLMKLCLFSLQSLELSNGLAIPLLVEFASRLPHIRSLKLRSEG